MNSMDNVIVFVGNNAIIRYVSGRRNSMDDGRNNFFTGGGHVFFILLACPSPLTEFVALIFI